MKYSFVQIYFFLSLIVGLILGSPSQSFAYTPKEGNVTATLAPYFYQTRFQGSDSGAQSPYLGGFGLIVLGDANDKGSLEIALLHTNKIYFREQGEKYIAEQVKLMQITMGYRWWLSHLWSASLTFTSSYPMGDSSIVHSDFAVGQEPTTSADDLTEYGLDISVQYDIWQNEKWAVISDFRYSLSVTNKPREYGDQQGILIGVRYLVQEGRP